MFEDIIRLDSHLPTINGLLTVLMGFGPDEANLTYGLAHALRDADNEFVGGEDKRVWWEFLVAGGEKYHYISLHPPEFRSELPADSKNIVRRLANSGPQDYVTKFLLETVEGVESSPFRMHPYLPDLVKKARETLHVISNDRDFSAALYSLQKFGDLIRNGECRPDSDMFTELYTSMVLGLKLPVVKYSQAELLLRIQAGLNLWIQIDSNLQKNTPYNTPTANLIELIRHIPAEKRIQSFQFLSQSGETTFRLGKKSVASALAEHSLYQHQEKLREALFYFSTALSVARILKEFDQQRLLSYKEIVAEESLVCTHSGLALGVTFFSANPDFFPRRIAAKSGVSIENLQSKEFELSSPIWPIFPSIISRMLIGRAKTLQGGKSLVKGINELEEIKEELSISNFSLFEIDWLDYCLLNSYREGKEEAKALQIAFSIAGRMVVSMALRQSE